MFCKKLFFNKKGRKNQFNPSILLINKLPQKIIWQSFLKNKIVNSFFLPIFLGLCFCFLWVSNAMAHFPDQSYLYFQVYDQDIEARVEITVSDLNEALNLDLPSDNQATVEDIEPHLPKIQEYINQKFIVSINNQEYPLEYKNEYDSFQTEFAQFFTFNYKLKNLQELPQRLKVYFGVLLDSKPEHKNLVVIEHNWKTGTFTNEAGVSLILTPDSQEQILDLSASSLWKGFLAMVRLGMLSFLKGINHILFLIALLLPSVLRREDSSWQPVKNFRSAFVYVLKIFLAFTVAHSITLALASLQIVEIPSRLVDALIAVSIAIAAFDIIYPILRNKIWWMIFGFGLFHGFAFANTLVKLGIIVTKEYPFLTLFGYNLGIELGQIIIILVVFPIVYLLRQQKFYSKGILKLVAIFLVAIGISLFLESSFNLNLGIEMAIKQFIRSILFPQ